MPAMRRFEWLEAMRGMAACWVLLHHAAQAARDFAGPLPTWAKLLHNGYLGVDFFFVLSGFIIATSSQQLMTSGRGWRDYASARMVRIYVPYLPIGVAMLSLYALFPGVSQGTRTDIGLLTSLTLLPSSAPPALSVAWTLVHEVLFYALFSLFFVSRRALVALLAVWAAAIVAVWATKTELSRAATYLLSPLNLCFILGVLLAWSPRRQVSGVLGVSLGCVGSVLVGSQALSAEPSRLLVAVGFGAMLMAGCSTWASRVSPGRVLLALGAASYSIYLVHNPVISVLARLHVRVPAVLLLLVGLGSLVAGLAYHFAFERYALRWARAQVSNVGSKTRIAGAPKSRPS